MERKEYSEPTSLQLRYSISSFRGGKWPQVAGGRDPDVVLCQVVNYINFFTLDIISKSHTVVITLY